MMKRFQVHAHVQDRPSSRDGVLRWRRVARQAGDPDHERAFGRLPSIDGRALSMIFTTRQKLFSEALGTALLLAVVIGSGVMAQRLAVGNSAIALLANALATMGGLYVLIEVFGPLSGAHFNPAVSLVMASRRELSWPLASGYVIAQLLGAVLGAWLVHAMFDMRIVQFSTKVRSGQGQWIAEGVATFGLLLVILRASPSRVAAMVSAYIGAAYWFTASTSFANPAAAFGRMFSDSFAGIAPASVPGFIAAELVGAALAVAVHNALQSSPRHTADGAFSESSHV